MTSPPDPATPEVLPTAPGFARACQLDALGRTEEAKQEYLAFLAGSPTHFGALNNLGTLLYESGYRSAARTAYAEAVKHHPGNPVGHINLANLLLASGELAEARRHYEAALALSPDHDEAHRGFANLLAELGEDDAAEAHRRAAYRDKAVVVQRYRGTPPGIPLLLLVSALGGNVPTRLLIDDRLFAVTALVADYVDPATPLPPHRLVFNAIGDADLSPRALEAAARLLAVTHYPVLNHPSKIATTGRAAIARRFAGVPGIVAPRIVMLPRAALESARGAALLAESGLAFPLLLRSPGFHTGRHFVRVEAASSLSAVLATLPGREVMAMQLLDARGADGLARKYRVMIVDGQLYPLHLAISADWKVHYFTAAMAEHPEHRAEEAAFLADMAGVLGPVAMAGLAHIRDALGLDYGGIDFAPGRDGALLLFEANSTMVVNPPDADPRWDYRRAPIERVLAAARRMVGRLAAG
ncbi:MAG TPA: tetratricopeptide repeat protein [Stellaceae bacterium]|nr:tetratricopeptide repeat protein [Stellaceae bacterium]